MPQDFSVGDRVKLVTCCSPDCPTCARIIDKSAKIKHISTKYKMCHLIIDDNKELITDIGTSQLEKFEKGYSDGF